MARTERDPASIAISRRAPLHDVANKLDAGGLGIALLLDDEGRLAATVTDGDIRRAMLSGINLDEPATRLEDVRSVDYREPVSAPVNAARAAQGAA